MAGSETTPDLAEALARIEAGKKRIGDLKAVYTRWRDGRSEFDSEERVISEMESIAYSVWCYLDGVPGQYLRPEDHPWNKRSADA